MQTINEFTWRQREDQDRTRIQVRDSEVRVGEYYTYRGTNTITKFADYKAYVNKITPYLIVMDIVLDSFGIYGIPRSYCVAIRRSELGRTERLYRR